MLRPNTLRSLVLGIALSFAADSHTQMSPLYSQNLGALPQTTGVDGVERLYADGFEELKNAGEAGNLPNVLALRAQFDLTDPVEPNNRSVMPYASLSLRGTPVLDDLQEASPTPLNLDLSDVPGTGHLNWNSLRAVVQANRYLKTNHLSNWPLPDSAACTVPVEIIDCCTYELTEGNDGSGDTVIYYDPKDLFADQSSASSAMEEIYAQIPMYLPFTNGDVRLVQGWIYNGSEKKPHGSIDLVKSTEAGDDSAFRVRTIAAGTVVAKYWDSWHGNVLVVEHPGPGDFTYRSFYFHLRNGKSNDINMAKERTEPSTDPKSSRYKYLRFADLASPNDLYWGTEDHKIPVNVGDKVSPQQMIAWSGNTGPGGAGAGLDKDGNPNDTITANNHLHFMVSVQHPDWTGGEWLYVDPYGVYEQQTTGCYDLLQPTSYDRLLAPYYPYFHGVDLGVVNFYLYYYGQMGLLPTTFSVQRKDNNVVASGAFKSGFGSGWYLFNYMNPADFQTSFNEVTNNAINFRQTDTSVSLNGANQPRMTAIFLPDTINNWSSYGNQTINSYQTTFENLTGLGQDLVDFFGYKDGNVDRISSIFAPLPGAFSHHGLLNSGEFTTLTNNLANDGWLPVDINVMEMNSGTWLSAIYRQTNDSRMVHWGMSSADYQQWMDFYLSSGWDLEVVQNYSSGERYAAIWSK